MVSAPSVQAFSPFSPISKTFHLFPFPVHGNFFIVWLSQRKCELQMRVAECNRVCGFYVRGTDWWFGWARRIVALLNGTQHPRRRAITVSTRRRTVLHHIDECSFTRATRSERRACGKGKSPRTSHTGFSVLPVCQRRLWTISMVN